MYKQLKNYQKAQCNGLNQRDLIIMCYKGAIKYLMDAKEKHAAGEREEFSDLLEKAHRVVFHLYTTLDLERGGEIAEKLADLYGFVISQIFLINATKNVELVDGLILVHTNLKEGWEQIDLTAIAGSAQDQVSQSESSMKIVSVEV